MTRVGNGLNAEYMVDYIPIENEKIPYSFDIKLEDKTYSMLVKYNEDGNFYTVDLSITSTGEVLCYGDPVRYGRQLFGSIEDERFPLPAIIPYCLDGDAKGVTRENFGQSVQLYLYERKAR